MKRALLVLASAALFFTTAQARQTSKDDAERLLKAAQNTEVVDGNPRAAIKQYQAIVAKFSKTQRGTAATALLRMAECYGKFGDEEAQKIYQQLVRDYADQPDVASQASARLTARAITPQADDVGLVGREIWSGSDLTSHVAPNAAIGFRVKPSADGQWLAFVDRASNGNVALRHVTSGEIRLVTKEARAGSGTGGWEGAELAYHPVLSPDGSQVAYEWASGGPYSYSIRVAPVGGGPAKVLGHGELYASAITWAPDGSRLAVVTGNARGGTDPYIAIISVSNGATTRLKSLPWTTNYSGAASVELGGFSPDGRFLVYAMRNELRPDLGGIFAIAVDGSQETALVQGTSQDSSPLWTPDGSAVMFVSDRSTGYGLWSIRVANGKPIGVPELVRGNVGPIQGLGFSRDGSFFYGRLSTQEDVYVADLDPSSLAVTSPPGLLSARFVGANRGASWSPDGRYLTFVRSTPSGDSVIIRSVDGTERTMPTTFRSGSYGFAVPTWYPDSRSVLVPEVDRSTRHSTFRRVHIDTLQEAVVLEGPNWEHRRLTGPSPDGKYVYYSKGQESAPDGQETVRLVRRDLETRTESELYRAEFHPGSAFFSPAISPDGSRLAIVAFNQGRVRSLMTVSTTAGGPPREVAHGDALPSPGDPDQTLQWTKDGRFILVVGYESGDRRSVWAFPSEGGEPRKLDLTMPRIRLTDVSPTGLRLAFTGTTTATPEIWELKRLLSGAGDAR